MSLRKRHIIRGMMAGAIILLLPSCRGILEDLYDEAPSDNPEIVTEGKLYVDASDWNKWHYIDFASESKENPDSVVTRVVTISIPSVADTDILPSDEKPASGSPGLYTYWYDVYGSGLDKREFRSFIPTEAQKDADQWMIAVHRNNVRTNVGAVAMTDYTDIASVPDNDEYLKSLSYKKDEWDESNVWVSQDQMLLGLIGNQGITVNKTLSSWLRVDIPPTPPKFTLNNRVFILHTADGEYYAIQLEDYRSLTNVKCCLTINYRSL